MNTMNMPGFTAEASLCKGSGRYQSVATQSYSGGEQRVVSQIRAGGFGIGVGGLKGGLKTGFWGECFLCTAGCTLLLGPEAILECLIACKDSGACD
jgi:hypothetical protein